MQQICGEDKDKGRQRVALSHSTQAGELLCRCSIEQDRRGTRGEDTFNPPNPFLVKAHVSHDLNHWFMLNRNKRFRKVQLQQAASTTRGLALVDVLECPGLAVLDRSPFKKTVLVSVDDFEDYTLQPISQQLGYQLQATVKEGDRPIIICSL